MRDLLHDVATLSLAPHAVVPVAGNVRTRAVAVAVIPSFSLILNIVGGVSMSMLSFMLPCAMLLQLRRFHLRAYAEQVAALHQSHSHIKAKLESGLSTMHSEMRDNMKGCVAPPAWNGNRMYHLRVCCGCRVCVMVPN